MDAQSPASMPDCDSEIDYKTRRALRRPIDEAARLSARTAYHIEVNVRNVSSCGFMAECAQVVPIGSFVAIDVPGIGPIQAQVRWQIGSKMGGMFTDPISLARCDWVGVKSKAG